MLIPFYDRVFYYKLMVHFYCNGEVCDQYDLNTNYLMPNCFRLNSKVADAVALSVGMVILNFRTVVP